MTAKSKIDSNLGGGLRYAEEASLGVLPGSPVWRPMEPNSYNNFGGNISSVARNPINDSRQRQKGTVTDLDASGGVNIDLVQNALQDIMQGVFFASLRRKAEFGNSADGGTGVITGVVASSHEYTAASGLNIFRAGDLVFGTGFANSANNGLKHIATASSTAPVVSETVMNETPTTSAKLTAVGFQFASGDAVITNSGTAYPTLTTTAKDLTQLGIIPGEWIFIGDDSNAAYEFATAANNCFARVRSVATNTITFDKTHKTMVTDNGSGKTVRIFVGRVVKNEVSTTIKRRSYNIERLLGVPDDDNPSNYQSEYLIGSVPNEFKLNVASAGKVTCDISFMSIDHETRSADDGVKSGSRPSIVGESAFNTSSDFSRMKMALASTVSGNPAALFAYVTDLSVTINNNVTPDKAVGVLGAFDVTAGDFVVTASATAYFADVAAVQAVRNNANVSLDAVLVKENAGIALDLPLVMLGDARANVVKDKAIELPLSINAVTAAAIDSNLNHTAMMIFFDYLPDLAG